MAIPDYQAFMLPMLRALADGRERTIRELCLLTADHFHLTESERNALLPSNQQRVVNNRVGWAKTYLKKAGLVDNPKRGVVRITDEGRKVLSTNPAGIDKPFLERYPSFLEFIKETEGLSTSSPARVVNVPGELTPSELLASSFRTLQEATKSELLSRLKAADPSFFEKAVVKLLSAMGYGVGGEATVTGKPGDGGIDGKISEDKLGLDVVCVQAKRYDSGTVGRQAVQAFVGSMDLERSKKGVMLTTSELTRDAYEFVQKIEGKKVVLINGKMLADLMLVYKIGVTTTETYELKEVSDEFFDEDHE